MNRKQYREFRNNLILSHLDSPKTINQVIQIIFEKDILSGEIYSRGWRFYVHLNKLPVYLERDNKIKHVATNDDGEKVWEIVK